MKTAKGIAKKYVFGDHDALTDNQEIIDMTVDIESYAKGNAIEFTRYVMKSAARGLKSSKLTNTDEEWYNEWMTNK